jgi:hypothetical protein
MHITDHPGCLPSPGFDEQVSAALAFRQIRPYLGYVRRNISILMEMELEKMDHLSVAVMVTPAT